jgi:2-methylcitrate dehydratase PrpD
MARAIDLDDVHEESIVHTGVAVVPAALAVAERQGAISGRDLMTAVALGQDLMIRLSAACQVPPNLQGRPGTYVFGTFATAAVTAKLLGFDRNRVVDALGNAYLRATGSTIGYHDGALSQRVLQGTSASEGVLAALLAEQGVGGVTNCLEARGGYYPLYEGGRYNRDVLLQDLGRTFRGTETSLKLFPVHRGLNLEIEAALVVATTNDYRADDIVHVAVRYPSIYAEGHANIGAFDPARADPKGPVEPHFADAWGVAVALVRRRATLDDFTEAGVAAIRAEVVPAARRGHRRLRTRSHRRQRRPQGRRSHARQWRRPVRACRPWQGQPGMPVHMGRVGGQVRGVRVACGSAHRPRGAPRSRRLDRSTG